jgi:glycosyltransferase involved in cell wall biosynthesis
MNDLQRIDASIIIPTYNRKVSLMRTLASIAFQTYPANDYEVVVIDDGSSDGTKEISLNDYPFRLVYLRQENKGSAAARNYGAQESHGEILIFTDDDITLAENYVAMIFNAVQQQAEVLAMGVEEPYLTGEDTIFQTRRAELIAERARAATADVEVSFDSCVSNNLGMRRDDFFAIGMWQDVLGDGPTLWGDVEFGYRAWELGFRFCRVSRARYVHRDHSIGDLATASHRAYHISRTAPQLFGRYPQIRSHLSMFREKEPIFVGQDPLRLLGRKAVLRALWSRPSVGVMKAVVRLLERYVPRSRQLSLLYRWILSAFIHKGYQ